MTDHPAQLFTDAELEPVEVVRRHRDHFVDKSWGAKCARCHTWLSKYDHTADEARRSGLAALDGHVCRGLDS